MRPYLLKGHERPLTYLKFNRDGDLLVTCAKDHNPCVWYSDNGERLGNYKGHNGAVWSCDISRNSKRLLTGSADTTAMLWDLESGTRLHTFKFSGPARSVAFSEGETQALVSVDPFMGSPASIQVLNIDLNSSEQDNEVQLKIEGPSGRINVATWGPLNETIIGAGEDCIIRMWDAETGKLLNESSGDDSHKKTVTDLQKSIDGSHFITGSSDKTAKLWDTRTLELLKTYQTERPINAAAIAPVLDHVVIGGGQDAVDVTMTSSRVGKFEAIFFHKIFEEEIGRVKGHFGPLNALAFSPDGRSFASGGEDGYVRLHHFDSDYYHLKV
eukprot:TRINITY_DN38451_c0_g1_i1.p1 TRINITY_DN38451_c0_g1~~TRINITY_DN38451_c0_g1_i1.p1  ORF type:complete len:327 (-),score=45.82 TRINITY_DN38451_c0_g1_i1:536-1516(-)